MPTYSVAPGWSIISSKDKYEVGEQIKLSIENADVCFENLTITDAGAGVLFHISEIVGGEEVFVNGAEDRISFGPHLPGATICAMYGFADSLIPAIRGIGWIPCGAQVQGGRSFRFKVYASSEPPAQDPSKYIQL